MSVPQLPHIRGQAVDSQGRYSPDFYRALGAIIKEIGNQGDQVTVLTAQIAELATSLGAEDGDPANITENLASSAVINGTWPIKVDGTLQSGAVTISFSSAGQSPGATWVRNQGPIDPAFTNDVIRIIPGPGRVTGVYILTQPAAGSCVIDIFKGSFSSFPSDSTITGSAKPTITGARTYSDTVLTGWDTSVSAFDFLRFHLESSTVFTYINIVPIIE